MLRLALATAALLLALAAAARAGDPPPLYVKTYGDPGRPAIVFLHGGPGYNAVSFERTTAEPLAARGFRVVVYDQRGCGRSPAARKEDYTFDRAIEDLGRVIDGLGPDARPLLVGHSFGGAVALRFMDRHPERVRGCVLVCAPISYPAGFRLIIARCRARFLVRGDARSLVALAWIERLDPASAQYAGSIFQMAMAAGLYTPRERTAEAAALSRKLAEAPDAHLVKESRWDPVVGFIDLERYTTLDLWPLVLEHRARISGIYGDEDWTLGAADRARLAETIGQARLVIVKGASHAVFIDRQAEFIEALARCEERP